MALFYTALLGFLVRAYKKVFHGYKKSNFYCSAMFIGIKPFKSFPIFGTNEPICGNYYLTFNDYYWKCILKFLLLFHSRRIKRSSSNNGRFSSDESNSSHTSSSKQLANNMRPGQRGRVGDSLYVQMPNNRKTCRLPYEEGLRISELIERICMTAADQSLDSLDYFVMLMVDDNNRHGLLDYTIPKETALLDMFRRVLNTRREGGERKKLPVIRSRCSDVSVGAKILVILIQIYYYTLFCLLDICDF